MLCQDQDFSRGCILQVPVLRIPQPPKWDTGDIHWNFIYSCPSFTLVNFHHGLRRTLSASSTGMFCETFWLGNPNVAWCFLLPGNFWSNRANIWTVYSLYITSWIGTAVLHMGLGTRELESFRPPLRCNEYLAVMTSGDSWSLGRCISKFYDVRRFNGQLPRIVFAWVFVCVNVTHGQHPRYFHHVEPNPKSWDSSCRIASM